MKSPGKNPDKKKSLQVTRVGNCHPTLCFIASFLLFVHSQFLLFFQVLMTVFLFNTSVVYSSKFAGLSWHNNYNSFKSEVRSAESRSHGAYCFLVSLMFLMCSLFLRYTSF